MWHKVADQLRPRWRKLTELMDECAQVRWLVFDR
jgi:uncharacterized NAD(P)/FAD-binding protein YdhS